MTARSIAALTALLALALLAAGCGSSSSDSTSSGGSTLSRTQFVKRANAICTKERESVPTRVAAYEKKAPAGLSPAEAQAAGVQAVLLPTFESEVTAIRALGAPAGDEQTVDAILSAQSEAIEVVAAKKDINPEEGGFEHYFDQADNLMRAYGLNGCTVR